ncbi:hypothetical protein [Deinococcus pimensis]|uniref:hypothetical protein n=1 Tax=Deinococcus pimensis TaxID=309888 RepID=UPI00048384BF|nr:hypothetical protein [Deinococcus pimensis]
MQNRKLYVLGLFLFVISAVLIYSTIETLRSPAAFPEVLLLLLTGALLGVLTFDSPAFLTRSGITGRARRVLRIVACLVMTVLAAQSIVIIHGNGGLRLAWPLICGVSSALTRSSWVWMSNEFYLRWDMPDPEERLHFRSRVHHLRVVVGFTAGGSLLLLSGLCGVILVLSALADPGFFTVEIALVAVWWAAWWSLLVGSDVLIVTLLAGLLAALLVVPVLAVAVHEFREGRYGPFLILTLGLLVPLGLQTIRATRELTPPRD